MLRSGAEETSASTQHASASDFANIMELLLLQWVRCQTFRKLNAHFKTYNSEGTLCQCGDRPGKKVPDSFCNTTCSSPDTAVGLSIHLHKNCYRIFIIHIIL